MGMGTTTVRMNTRLAVFNCHKNNAKARADQDFIAEFGQQVFNESIQPLHEAGIMQLFEPHHRGEHETVRRAWWAARVWGYVNGDQRQPQTFMLWGNIEVPGSEVRTELWKEALPHDWATQACEWGYSVLLGGGDDLIVVGFASEAEARKAAADDMKHRAEQANMAGERDE